MSLDHERRKARRADKARIAAVAVEAYKLAAGCIDCGYREHPAALHFDHVDPQSKRAELGWFEDRSKLVTHARLTAFLAHVERYCEVRCGNCHAVRSARERHWAVRRDASEPRSAHPSLF